MTTDKETFYIILIKNIEGDEQPLMQKISKNTSALLLWDEEKDAVLFIKQILAKELKQYYPKKVDYSFYIKLQDDFKLIKQNIILKKMVIQ